MYYQNNQQPMMGMGQGMPQQQLPVLQMAQQPMTQHVMVQPGQPPFIPQVNVAPEMQQLLPLITSIAIIELQSHAGKNNLRMFAFNLYARNAYNNPEFAELIQILTGHVFFRLLQSRVQDPQSLILQIVPQVITLVVGSQVQFYPDLTRMMSPQQMQEAQNFAGMMQQIVAEINSINQQRQPQNQFQQGGFYQGQGMMNGGMLPQGGFNQQQNGQGLSGGSAAVFGTGGMGARPEVRGLNHLPSIGTNRTAQVQANQSQMLGTGMPGQKLSETALRMRRQLAQQNGMDVDDYGNMITPEHAQTLQSQKDGQQFEAAAPTQVRFSRGTVADLIKSQPQHVEQTPAPQQQSTGFSVKQPVQPRDPAVISEVSTRSVNEALQQQVLQSRPMVEPVFEPQPFAAQQQYQAPTEPVQQGNEVEVDSRLYEPSEVTWKPSEEQPFHPAWNYFEERLAYVKAAGGVVLAVAVKLTDEEKTSVDYEKHAVGRFATKPSLYPKPAKVKNEDPVTTIEPTPSDEPIVVNANYTNFDTGVESAMAYQSVATRLQSNVFESKNDVFITSAQIAVPLLCDAPELAAHFNKKLAELQATRTFAQVVKVMESLTAEDEMQLFNQVNRSLTSALNDALRFGLNLPKATVGDFYNDALVVDGTIRKAKGDGMANALKAQEARIIKSAINLLSENDANEMYLTLVGEADIDAADRVTFLGSTISAAYLDQSVTELGLAVKEGVSMLTESSTPFVYKVAQKLMALDGETRTDRHKFIVTSDSLRLELTRGISNPSSFLIRVA